MLELEFWIACDRGNKDILSTRKTVIHSSVAESGRRWILRLVRFLFFPGEEYFMQTRCFPSQETISPRGWLGERNLIKFSKTTNTPYYGYTSSIIIRYPLQLSYEFASRVQKLNRKISSYVSFLLRKSLHRS